MKIIFYLFILLINNAIAEDYPTIDLNSQNLELLALKKSTDTDLKKYVLNLIKTQYPKEYYPIIKYKDKVAVLVEKYTKEVQLAASKLSEKTNFKLEYNIQYLKFDDNNSNLIIKNFLIGNTVPISTDKLTDDGMPSNFQLLIPNIKMMNNFKVDTSKFKSLIENRKNNRNKNLYMQVIVNLIKFQNGENFQTVIKEVKIYDSPNMKVLLATKTEKTKTNDLIGDWLLSEGFTNRLIGIHAFSYFGYRLQDQMRSISSLKSYCEKTQKIGKHQVVLCIKPYGDNVYIIGTYIGGIVAKVDLVAKAKLSENDKKVIIQQLRVNLNQPKSILNQKHVHWKKYNVDFDFYSDAFNGIKSKESKYNFMFGTNKKFKDLDLTIITSMMSHETKKLIEENK